MNRLFDSQNRPGRGTIQLGLHRLNPVGPESPPRSLHHTFSYQEEDDCHTPMNGQTVTRQVFQRNAAVAPSQESKHLPPTECSPTADYAVCPPCNSATTCFEDEHALHLPTHVAFLCHLTSKLENHAAQQMDEELMSPRLCPADSDSDDASSFKFRNSSNTESSERDPCTPVAHRPVRIPCQDDAAPMVCAQSLLAPYVASTRSVCRRRINFDMAHLVEQSQPWIQTKFAY